MSAHSTLMALALAGGVLLLSGCGSDDATVVPTDDPGVAAEFVIRALHEADAGRWGFEVYADQWQEVGGAPGTNWSYDPSLQAWRDSSLSYQSVWHGGAGNSYEVRTQYRYKWTLRLMAGGVPTSAWSQADSLAVTWFRALDRYVVDDVRELDDAYQYGHWGTATARIVNGMAGVATGSGHVEGQEEFPDAPGGLT